MLLRILLLKEMISEYTQTLCKLPEYTAGKFGGSIVLQKLTFI